MNRRDIVIGIVILLGLAAIALVLRRPSKTSSVDLPIASPSIEEKLESALKVDLPSDAEKKELRDVAGVNGIAIATRKYEEGVFSLTILADLPELANDSSYQAWITKDSLSDEKSVFVNLGRLKVSKGGWMLEYSSKTDLSENKNILISQESDSDAKPEKHIMEGSF